MSVKSYDISLPISLQSSSNVANSWILKGESNFDLSFNRSGDVDPVIILSNNSPTTSNTQGWLNVSSITAHPNTLFIFGNLKVSNQIITESVIFDDLTNPLSNTLTIKASNTQVDNLTIILPPLLGSNGNSLRSLGNGETVWANASISLFNASVDIISLVLLPSNNFNIKLSSNANVFTPGAPAITITDPGPLLSDIIEVPAGRTFLRAWGILQLQFPLLGASQQRLIFTLNTTTGSGSRGAVSTVPAATNNWRVSPATEVQGVTSNISPSLAWGLANIVPTLLSNSFISIQYY